MFGHNIVNKWTETRGSGERSAYTAHTVCSDPRGATTSCEKAVLIECYRTIDNLKAAVYTVRMYKEEAHEDPTVYVGIWNNHSATGDLRCL